VSFFEKIIKNWQKKRHKPYVRSAGGEKTQVKEGIWIKRYKLKVMWAGHGISVFLCTLNNGISGIILRKKHGISG